MNVIPKRLEKYMSFSVDNKLVFIDSFQFLSSLLDNLFKKLGENDFKHLNLIFKNLIVKKQKRFYPFEHMCNIEKFNEPLPSKNKFYNLLIDKKNQGEIVSTCSKSFEQAFDNDKRLSQFELKM